MPLNRHDQANLRSPNRQRLSPVRRKQPNPPQCKVHPNTGYASKQINDASPTSLNHLIGQGAVIAQVKTALDAAFEDNSRFDDALLVGPPGTGKSQLAAVIAQEIATEFHEVLGQSIKGIGDLNALLLAANDKDILHIDEAHELDKQFQTALYLAIDKRTISVNSKQRPESIPIANFTLLLSTTDEYDLLAPLRDRMKLTLRFEYYSNEELATLLRHRAKALGWPVDEQVLPLIAQRSKGVPRLALRLLQSCRRVCRAEGEKAIFPVHFERAVQLEQIDSLGLGSLEKKYLAILKDGASRLNVIASILGLPTRTVSEVTEQFLIRAGLIEKDKDGLRELTSKGRNHILGK
jgi:holliday junction DNA helicase RuvB